MEKYKIEKGIEIQKMKRSFKPGGMSDLLARMEIGDSVLVNPKALGGFRSAARIFFPKYKIVARTVEKGKTCRIWRVE